MMGNKNKLTVGQTVWLVRATWYRSDSKEPIEAIVTRVGKKYFEIDRAPRAKFEIETLRSATDTNYVDRCHLSLQEILDQREFEKLSEESKKVFNTYGNPKLSLSQLRRIVEIIKEPNE